MKIGARRAVVPRCASTTPDCRGDRGADSQLRCPPLVAEAGDRPENSRRFFAGGRAEAHGRTKFGRFRARAGAGAGDLTGNSQVQQRTAKRKQIAEMFQWRKRACLGRFFFFTLFTEGESCDDEGAQECEAELVHGGCSWSSSAARGTCSVVSQGRGLSGCCGATTPCRVHAPRGDASTFARSFVELRDSAVIGMYATNDQDNEL